MSPQPPSQVELARDIRRLVRKVHPTTRTLGPPPLRIVRRRRPMVTVSAAMALTQAVLVTLLAIVLALLLGALLAGIVRALP